MKVLAVNGSPRGKEGNTEVMLDLFLKGCEKAGAEVETIYLKDKKINHCTGCFSCWTKTPGKCIHKDDMEELLQKRQEADMIVYATPLYVYTVTGLLKDFMDRSIPLATKEIIKVGDKYAHPKRVEKEAPLKTVLISNCGFPGNYNFSGLVETFKVMTKGNLAGAIVCAQGGPLNHVKDNEELAKAYTPFLAAVERAGEEIIIEGSIRPETQEMLDKPVMDPDKYIENANRSW